MKTLRSSQGFTLLEALISVALATVFIGGMLSVWVYSSKNFKEENVLSESRFGLEKSIERLKQDVRLSDGNNILFYPSAAPYAAISLPATTADANGFFTFGSSSISWNRTIVYHVYDTGSSVELRRTTFASFLSSTAARQTQLDNLVANGSDAGGTTQVMYSGDSVSLDIVPSAPSFDGYNATLEKSTLTSFGSALIAAGNHDLKFRITGKNALSSGYRMGFDQFVASPSGDNGQEAEALTISGSSGSGSTAENMVFYAANGTWEGNYQLQYQSGGVGDYIQFQIYNDQWIESNFGNMTHSNTEVSGTDPKLTVATRENQSLSPAWKAESQTGVVDADNPSSVSGMTIRNIIDAASILKGGQLIRFKFRSSTAVGSHLKITEAHFGVRQPGTYNFSGLPTQLHFSNGAVNEGSADAVGAVGSGGPVEIEMGANQHAWTNWVEIPITFPAANDYLLSFSVDGNPSKGDEVYWNGAATHSYMETGATATATWTPVDPGLTADDSIHAVEEISSWANVGTATSQIYDTKMTSPALASLSWTTNGSGTYSFKVRSSADSQMIGAPDWSAVSSYSSSPAALSGSGSRYIQFQATLTSVSPYATYPTVDNVTMRWPGRTTLVDFSGMYTKRPDYGMFEVLLDGSSLYNALDVTLSGSKTYQGKSYDVTMSASIRAKNTGK